MLKWVWIENRWWYCELQSGWEAWILWMSIMRNNLPNRRFTLNSLKGIFFCFFANENCCSKLTWWKNNWTHIQSIKFHWKCLFRISSKLQLHSAQSLSIGFSQSHGLNVCFSLFYSLFCFLFVSIKIHSNKLAIRIIRSSAEIFRTRYPGEIVTLLAERNGENRSRLYNNNKI